MGLYTPATAILSLMSVLASAESNGSPSPRFAVLLAGAMAYVPKRPYPRCVRRQIRRTAEAPKLDPAAGPRRGPSAWTGNIWRPLRTLYKREQLLDDWSEMQKERRTPRMAKLANVTFSERVQDAVARADMPAVERDWERLEEAISYLPEEEHCVVRDALIVAYGAHAGQNRRSGEPFICHPVAVAILLAGLSMDRDTIVAGLLHDTVEDTFLRFEDVERRFGVDVRSLVEGETKVSKLPKLDATLGSETQGSKELEQLENLRQMFVAMTDDYRIIIIKLADRLHNMRTLEHMPRHKQIRISRETVEIFAPLAHRLGIWQFKAELEEIAFGYLYPRPAAALAAALETRRPLHSGALQGVTAALKQKLAKDSTLSNVGVTVAGRTKETYSLWNKLKSGRDAKRDDIVNEVFGSSSVAPLVDDEKLFAARDLDNVPDVVAVRVILDVPRLTETETPEAWRERGVQLCYHVLGAVQHLADCEAVPRVKDYIAFPKPNGYQSLHASVQRLPENQAVEIQIRTRGMHEVAEHGMAAHWLYKDGLLSPRKDDMPRRASRNAADALAKTRAPLTAKPYALEWLNAIKDMKDIHSSREFVETIRREVLGKRVFVFLRDGRILDLSKGATVLDAAFSIHTDVGLHLEKALINGHEVQPSYQLHNGDVISIQTSADARPQLDWLRMAQRRSTRAKLRAYFKREGCFNDATSPPDEWVAAGAAPRAGGVWARFRNEDAIAVGDAD